MISLLAVLILPEAQGRPTPLIHYLPPSIGETESRFACGQTEVRFRIEVTEDRVSVVSYRGAAGHASPEQLARWNAWLAPMRKMISQRSVCVGENENLEIQGTRTQIDGPISVSVYWYQGQMDRYPDPNQQYRQP
jgi:hypothetical protein